MRDWKNMYNKVGIIWVMKCIWQIIEGNIEFLINFKLKIKKETTNLNLYNL